MTNAGTVRAVRPEDSAIIALHRSAITPSVMAFG